MVPLVLACLGLLAGTGSPAALAADNALFLSQSVPTTLSVGATHTVSITMFNSGSTSWSEAGLFRLGTQNPQDNTTWTGGTRIQLGPSEVIGPGQQKTFTFDITAPSSPGTYNFQWQMVHDTVAWFGGKTQNVAIVVTQPQDGALFVSQSVPSTMLAGETQTVSVTMLNSGGTTWTKSSGYKLGTQNPQDNTTWTGSTRVLLAAGDSIAPGQSKTFTFDITAPSSPGNYDFQWKMLREGVDWFGAKSQNVVIDVDLPEDNATFVSQSVPSSLFTGETRTVSVTFHNAGDTTWTRSAGYKLGTQNPQDNTTWTGSTRVLLGTGDSIAPGQSKTFTFDITAPSSPGNYNFQWKMVHEGVDWFGAKSQNVTIDVEAPEDDATFVSQSVPSSLLTGETRTVSVTFHNAGDTTWTRADDYRLGTQNPQDNTTWTGGTRILLGTGDSIAPGQSKTFTFDITAPSSPGTHNFQWKMLREGFDWFGAKSQNVAIDVEAPEDDAAFVSQSVPSSLSVGETRSVSVTMQNTGDTTWTRADDFRLGTQNPQDNTTWTGGTRILLGTGDSIAPGQSKTFTFDITAPSSPGTHNFQWKMVHEGVDWFGAKSQNVAIAVTQPEDDAAFVSQSVPSSLFVGETRSVSITLLNDGETTWTRADDYRLGTENPQDNTTWTGGTRILLGTGDSIAPGQSKTFTFDITAPSSPGFHNFQWRMLREGFDWFGAFTQNILIEVREREDLAQFVSQSVPSSMSTGETRSVSITMLNNGDTTWTEADLFRLGTQNPEDNTTWTGGTRILLAPGDSIAPGQSKTFSFDITAPSAPGSHNFQWRMVHDTVDWFGDFTQNVLIEVNEPASGDDAAFVSQSVPLTIGVGETRTVSISFSNSGTSTWTELGLYRLGTQNPQDNTVWTGQPRVYLDPGESVAPGSVKTFTFDITAPSSPGFYNFQWRMVHDTVDWFGDFTQNLVIEVTDAADQASVFGHTFPNQLDCNQVMDATVTIQNTGTTTWTEAGDYALQATGSSDPFRPSGDLRFPLGSTTVAPGGTVVFTIGLTAPAQAGTYDTSWSMVRGTSDYFGENFIRSIVVECAGSGEAPVITSLFPDVIENGVRTLTLTGSNFQGATVSIPTADPPDDPPSGAGPGGPGGSIGLGGNGGNGGESNTFPTATLLSVTPDGTEMTVRIDASDPDVRDFYNLALSNSEGEDVAQFRVIPGGPSVDLWTPAQPSSAAELPYALSIAGNNLLGATVTAEPSGRVSLFRIDNSANDNLSGFLRVVPGAPTGPVDLVVRNHGQTVRLPINVVNGFNSTLTTVNILEDLQVDAHGKPDEPGLAATPGGGLLLQEFAVREGWELPAEMSLYAPSAPIEGTSGIWITFSERYNLYHYIWTQDNFVDPGTGLEVYDDFIDLVPGSEVLFSTYLARFLASVDITVFWQFNLLTREFSWPLFCFEVVLAYDVLGIEGNALFFNYCFGGQAVNGNGGTLSTMQVSGGDCAEVIQEGPVIDGRFTGRVRQNECCEQDIEVEATGQSFICTTQGCSDNGVVNYANGQAATTTPAASCGPGGCSVLMYNPNPPNAVPDVPAACIVKDRNAEYGARGNPSGGSYSWSIPQGGDKVSFSSGTQQQVVTLEGDTLSGQADDIMLKVDYTVGGSTCSVTEALSVIEIDNNFDRSGTADTLNTAAQGRADQGLPKLGPIKPNDPIGAIGWYKNMQIKGTVIPCDPNLRCHFDYKRIRQGWVISEFDNTICTPHSMNCPQGGCFDDAHNTDEDLILDGPGPNGCGIYVVDTPGFTVGSTQPMPCTQAQADADSTQVNCQNFNEWLEVDGYRATDDTRWYASTRNRCKAAGQQFEYLPNGGGVGNKIRKGVANCASGLPTTCTGVPSPQFAQPTAPLTVDVTQWLVELQSPSAATRRAAYDEILIAEARGLLDPHSRGDLIRILTNQLPNGLTSSIVGMDSTPLLATRLLGHLEAKESIESLIETIDVDYPRAVATDLDQLTPSALSLSQIGSPAIDPILDEVGVASDLAWADFSQALVLMEDRAKVVAAANKRLNSVLRSDQARARLEALLAVLN